MENNSQSPDPNNLKPIMPQNSQQKSSLFENFQSQFTSLLSRGANFKKYINVVGSVSLTAILIATLIVGANMKRFENLSSKASGVSLSLSTTNANPKVGDTFVVAAAINTNGLKLSAADINLQFSSQNLELMSTNPLPAFLPVVLRPASVSQIDSYTSKVTIALGAKADATVFNGATGVGVPIQFVFKALSPGKTNISIGSDTAVAVIGQKANALDSAAGIGENILSASISSTPVVSILPKSTPSPSPVVTITPSPSARQTTQPTPTKTSTPSPAPLRY